VHRKHLFCAFCGTERPTERPTETHPEKHHLQAHSFDVLTAGGPDRQKEEKQEKKLAEGENLVCKQKTELYPVVFSHLANQWVLLIQSNLILEAGPADLAGSPFRRRRAHAVRASQAQGGGRGRPRDSLRSSLRMPWVLQLPSYDSTRYTCNGPPSEAASKASQQRSQPLRIQSAPCSLVMPW
jgi:hypothetical protein